jgi:outer membrane protein TolC
VSRKQASGSLPARWRHVAWLIALAWVSLSPVLACAGPPPTAPAPLPLEWTLDAAVLWALQHNPELAATRQQHGIAAAAIVIARTYPFNPIYEGSVWGDWGPREAITNRVPFVQALLLEVEVNGQRGHRLNQARAALSRTDWEIATQELNLAVRVVRAFNAVVYRKQKLRLLEEILRLQEEAVEQVRKLVEQGQLRQPDLIVARTEVDDTRAQLGPARNALAVAWAEFYRALGLPTGPCEAQGTLEVPVVPCAHALLVQAALQQRPELHARQAAVAEADARLRLEMANRCGNPTVGPSFERNESSVNFAGIQFVVPVPLLNCRQGEIMQRQAERHQALLQVQQTAVQVQQDVQAALARLATARSWAETYRTETLPNLQKALEAIQQLFALGEPGVDLLRVLDLRRKLIRARDAYLDAQWEVNQAQVDLAAAVADVRLAVVPPCPPQPPSLTLEPDNP